jgi:hypothetical protein
MVSELKSAAARINGSKSHGPTSAQGLAKSSQNALKHGGAATPGLLLKSESAEEYEAMRATLLATHKPAGPEETALVDQMAAARWRMLRFDQIEAGILDEEIDRQQTLSRAFRALCDQSKALALASRYQSRQHRIHDSAYKTLRELQRIRLAQEPERPTHVEYSWITPEERIEREKMRAEASRPKCTCGNCTCQPAILPNEPSAAANEEVTDGPGRSQSFPKSEIRNPKSLFPPAGSQPKFSIENPPSSL